MTHLTITGMTCNHCKNAVQNALTAVPGVTHVHVDLEEGRADVEGGDLAALLAAVTEEGYDATPQE